MPAALLAVALLALLAALALPLGGEFAPGARAHLAFAAGILPLVLAAIGYFVPVLTRTRAAPAAARVLPWLALAGGVLAAGWFFAPSLVRHGHALAASIAAAAAIAMFAWITARSRTAVGAAHPCLRWYSGALACLALALVAVIAMPFAPEHHAALRRAHLHLNTAGFIALTAFGTLQVLLPTAAGRPDPGAAARLRSDFPLALSAALATAAGAALLPVLALAGAALWMIPLARCARAWQLRYAGECLAWHGAAPSLAAALIGLAATVTHGAAHALGAFGAANTAAMFIAMFLLPLVTGAATQLLPTWLRPGPQSDWHASMRTALGRWSAVRALAFLCGGVAIAFDHPIGASLAALALLGFIAGALMALVPPRRAATP